MAALASALQTIGGPSMVIGGMAVIARGVPRHTVDIDATVWAEGLDIDRVFAVLAEHAILPRIADARAFALERQVLLLQHQPSGTPLDVSLAWLPFEQDALNRASLVDFAGVTIAVAQAEDLVIYKTIAWRDHDRTDVERLLVLHGPIIDMTRVRSLVRQFAEALDTPERVSEFEVIVRRAAAAGGPITP
jgi:hypothetical protein